MSKYVIATPDAEDFHTRFKASLTKCRDSECFSVLITRQPGSFDFTLCLQVDANKKAVRSQFRVVYAPSFRFVRASKQGPFMIGHRRTNEAGIDSLCTYIHAVMGGVFCKASAEPLLDALLLDAPPELVAPPEVAMPPEILAPPAILAPPVQARSESRVKPEQNNTEDSE